MNQNKLFKLWLLAVILFAGSGVTWGQTTIFTESMGTVSKTTAIAAHENANGFDNDAYLQFKESILWSEESWRHSISRCQIIKWTYLSDILPKEGGEQ